MDAGLLSNEETKAQRGEVTCLRPHSQALKELAAEPRIASSLGLDSHSLSQLPSLPQQPGPGAGPIDPLAGPAPGGTEAGHLHPLRGGTAQGQISVLRGQPPVLESIAPRQGQARQAEEGAGTRWANRSGSWAPSSQASHQLGLR